MASDMLALAFHLNIYRVAPPWCISVPKLQIGRQQLIVFRLCYQLPGSIVLLPFKQLHSPVNPHRVFVCLLAV